MSNIITRLTEKQVKEQMRAIEKKYSGVDPALPVHFKLALGVWVPWTLEEVEEKERRRTYDRYPRPSYSHMLDPERIQIVLDVTYRAAETYIQPEDRRTPRLALASSCKCGGFECQSDLKPDGTHLADVLNERAARQWAEDKWKVTEQIKEPFMKAISTAALMSTYRASTVTGERVTKFAQDHKQSVHWKWASPQQSALVKDFTEEEALAAWEYAFGS
jgi:hypothetical protein